MACVLQEELQPLLSAERLWAKAGPCGPERLQERPAGPFRVAGEPPGWARPPEVLWGAELVLSLEHEAPGTRVQRACGGGGGAAAVASWQPRPRLAVGPASPCAGAPRNAPVPQPVPALELEALRLSLSNLHAAQLERTQATLQREKEAALTELRAALNGRHAQELALLRSRQQQEQALAREQHARERQEVELRCRQETGAACRPGPGLGAGGCLCGGRRVTRPGAGVPSRAP